MMDRLRLPFFIAALCFFVLAVLIEWSATDLLTRISSKLEGRQAPGIAINYLAFLDAIILYTLAWMALDLVVPRGIAGRVHGIVSLVISFFALLAMIVVIFATFGLLMLMISLLVAVPFGTIAYIAAWGDFATKAAAATLGFAMLLKLICCVFLVLAHQRFLQNKGLVILIALSLALTWATAFVQALLPLFLVSIGDALVALIIAVVAALWLLFILIGAIIALVKAIISLRQIT